MPVAVEGSSKSTTTYRHSTSSGSRASARSTQAVPGVAPGRPGVPVAPLPQAAPTRPSAPAATTPGVTDAEPASRTSASRVLARPGVLVLGGPLLLAVALAALIIARRPKPGAHRRRRH